MMCVLGFCVKTHLIGCSTSQRLECYWSLMLFKADYRMAAAMQSGPISRLEQGVVNCCARDFSFFFFYKFQTRERQWDWLRPGQVDQSAAEDL